MGVSLKISKRGTRVKPKPVNPKSNSTIEDDEHPVEISSIPSNNVLNVSTFTLFSFKLFLSYCFQYFLLQLNGKYKNFKYGFIF